MSPRAPNAILLTWNPEQGRPLDLVDGHAATESGQVVFCRWSTGSTKNIEPGTRCFLMRQRLEPKGIVASGHVVTSPEHEETTPKTHYAMVAFTMMFDVDANPDAVVPLEELMSDPDLAATHFLTAGGGIRIRPETIEPLEEAWRALLELQDTEEVKGKADDWILEGEERRESGEVDAVGEYEEDEEDEEYEEYEEDEEDEENEEDGVTLEGIRKVVREEVAAALEDVNTSEAIEAAIRAVLKDASKGGILSKVEIALRLRGLEKRAGSIERVLKRLEKGLE